MAGKILIIDDDNRNIFALKAVLKSKGFHCTSTTGGREGLDALQNDRDIAIVLLDMMMPDMDGYETLGHIRQGPRKDIPVISVTAQAMVGDKEKCIEAGANGYLSKPIDVDALLNLLNKHLRR